MKIVFLNGGLANQVFQYAFYRFAQLRHPEEDWVMDDSFFFVHDVHNGYELESVFGLKPNLLSQRFEPDVWEYMIESKRQGKSMPEILNENGMQFIMLSEYDNWKQWNPFSGSVQDITAGKFFPELMDLNGDIYYHGYWLIPDYLKRNDGQVLRELQFVQSLSNAKRELCDEIGSVNSIGVHIRRGDFATLGINLPESYYRDAIPELDGRVGDDPVYYVFSDDIEWCREHAEELGLLTCKQVAYVKPEEDPNQAWQDMMLMSQCRNMILSNSSFCYLATLMNHSLREFRNPSARNIFLGDMVYDVNHGDKNLIKRCLLNYTTVPFEKNLRETEHQNIWQSIALAYLLGKSGYIVDVRQYSDMETEPEPGIYYDLLIDTHPDDNTAFQQHLKSNCKRIAYMTTANPTYNNDQEQKRLEVFYQKKPKIAITSCTLLLHTTPVV